MKILHIVATPRTDASNSLRFSELFLGAVRQGRSDVEVETIDLFNEDLPAMAGDNIETKYTLTQGQPIDKDHVESWRAIEALIGRFLAADAYVISTPMWNFGIPYALKYFIDCIVQPGYLFKFNEEHYPVPLVHGKRMVCVTSRGSDYSGPMAAMDFQEPYLRTVFGFVGITDLEFVSVQPTDIGFLREAAFATATARVESLAQTWIQPADADPVLVAPDGGAVDSPVTA
jgi:FMN-dependent NADH-azoreductase